MTTLQLYTLLHFALIVISAISGILVLKGLIQSHGRQLWTLLFLVSATAAAIVGLIMPFRGASPTFVVGMMSLVPIALSFLSRYHYRRMGIWRGVYAISAVATLYAIAFILLDVAFDHVPLLNTLAPTKTEILFYATHAGTAVVFVALAWLAHKRYLPKKEALNEGYISPHLEPEIK